jgi:hypothetical protein
MKKQLKILRSTEDPAIIPHKQDQPLKVVKGPPSDNWLSTYPAGTVFHSRLKHHPPYGYDWVCTQYRIIFQYVKTTSLWDVMAENDAYQLVDSQLFSDNNVLVEVLEYGKGGS